MISYILPTHARAATLAHTLSALGDLPAHDARVIIIDNASPLPASAPARLANGISVEILRLASNRGTAARNAGAAHAIAASGIANHWLVMLDDDSAPCDLAFIPALAAAPPNLAVLAAEVLLPSDAAGNSRHEAGGLPEVFIGCGAAIRAHAWQAVGGYDPAFDYYAEEYDLSASLLLAGFHIRYDRRFRVMHRKVTQGRDMDRIMGNLVRNNAWVMARYAPPALREQLIQLQIDRYAAIARKENAFVGYEQGLAHLHATLADQPRTPLPLDAWHRFTGYAAASASLTRHAASFRSVAIVDAGKNVEVITQAALDAGLHLTDESSAHALLIGTLSPGPMLEAHAARVRDNPAKPVLMPWTLAESC